MHPTLDALDREWRQLSRSDEAKAAVARWAATAPILASARDLQDVLVLRTNNDIANEVLHALARRAPDDWLAARTLLQALVPGLIVMTRKSAADDVDGISGMVGFAWERIRTYPESRHGSVAGNVLLDARKWYWGQRRREQNCRLREVPSDTVIGILPARPQRENVELAAIARLKLRTLSRAVREGLVTELEFRIIVRTRIEGLTLAEVAEEVGLSCSTVKKLRLRAEARLRALHDGAA